MRLLKGSSLNHLSCQKDRTLFFTTIHLMPLLKIDSPFFSTTYLGEQDLSLNGDCLRLLACLWVRTLAQSKSFSWWKRQLILASKAEFFSLADWRPRPPSFFGLVNFFQLTKWSFFLPSVVPQIKLQQSLSTLWVTFEGRAAHYME